MISVTYCQTPTISRTLVGNKIVDHVVGALTVTVFLKLKWDQFNERFSFSNEIYFENIICKILSISS